MKRILTILAAVSLAAACSRMEDNANFIPDFKYQKKEKEIKTYEHVIPDVIPDDCLKIMSFNIRVSNADLETEHCWANRRYACLAVIRKENASVVGIQECLEDQLKFLRDSLANYSIISNSSNTAMDETCPILYRKDRISLISTGVYWLSETPSVPSTGWDEKYIRQVTWAIFENKPTGDRFLYMNTHGALAKLARLNGMKLVMEKLPVINPDDYPGIINADFNATDGHSTLEPLTTRFSNVRETAPITDRYGTYNNYGYRQSIIDHIYYYGLVPLKFRTVRDSYCNVMFVSDHFPICAEFNFKK